jgi:hypothetical protein
MSNGKAVRFSNLLVGLFAVGTLGATSALKRKNKQDI